MIHFSYKVPGEILAPDLRSSIILVDNTTIYFPKVQLNVNVGKEAHLFYDSLIGKQCICACHKDIYYELKNVILSPVESSGKLRTKYLLSLFKLLYWPLDKKRNAITQSILETIDEIKRRKRENLLREEVEIAIEAYIVSTKDLVNYSETFTEPNIFVVSEDNIPELSEKNGVLFFHPSDISIGVGIKSKYILQLITNDSSESSSHREIYREIRVIGRYMILVKDSKMGLYTEYFIALVKLLYLPDNFNFCLLDDVEKSRKEVHRRKAAKMSMEKVLEATQINVEHMKKIINCTSSTDISKYIASTEKKVIISTTDPTNISWTKKGDLFILEGQFTISQTK